MAVFAGWCGCQADDIFRFDLSHHLFETEGRKVVALIDDYVAVLCDESPSLRLSD
jgi:hypothetical protein